MGATIINRLMKTLKTVVARGVFFLTTLLMAAGAFAGQATLAWDANTDPAVAGYMIHYGQSSGVYTGTADAGKLTSFTVTGLQDGATYFYVVTAYDASRAESGYSNQASAVVPASAPLSLIHI